MVAIEQLFNQAIGLSEPWRVERVDFSLEREELHLYLDFARGGKFACPECVELVGAYDSEADRVWRHLNFFQYETYLHARRPRVNCAACGVKTVEVPWARAGSGFTLLFEALVMTLAQAMPVQAAARLMGEHDKRLWRVVEHYVQEARKRVDMSSVQAVGVDETAARRGHDYVTIFADLEKARVLFVTAGRKAATVAEFRNELIAHGGDPQQVKVVCSDLSPAYQLGIREQFPQAQIVLDRFHVVQLVNQAIDQVRRKEVHENALLRNSRYLWLKNPENLTSRQSQKLNPLLTMNSATALAYQMKLNLQEFWELPDRQSAKEFLHRWYHWVMHSDIAHAMKKTAKTLLAHAYGLLSYFDFPVSNGLLEALNSLFQAANAKARGFRTNHYLQLVLYLVAGKLDLSFALTHSK